MNGASKLDRRPAGVLGGVGSFGADLTTLAVLQARLVKCDLREGLRKARAVLVVVVVFAVLALAGVFTLVLGVGFWVSTAFQITWGAALMAVGTACTVISGLVVALGLRKLTSGPPVLQHSIEEFERNLAWVKTTLTQSGR
jgi:hypothetical protein